MTPVFHTLVCAGCGRGLRGATTAVATWARACDAGWRTRRSAAGSVWTCPACAETRPLHAPAPLAATGGAP